MGALGAILRGSRAPVDKQVLNVGRAALTSGTAPVQLATGIRFDVPGGAATPDPGDGIWATWPLIDVLGRRCKTGTVQPFDVFQALLWLQEITPPLLTDQAYIAMGLCTGPNLAGAVNGYFGAITYAGGIRTARAGVLAAGTATHTDDASPQGDLRQVQIDNAYSFGGQFSTVQVVGLAASGSNIFGNFDTVSRAAAAAFGAAGADPHVFMAAGRTSNQAGTVQATARGLYSALAAGKIPAVP
jgi:hypothetical protein